MKKQSLPPRRLFSAAKPLVRQPEHVTTVGDPRQPSLTAYRRGEVRGTPITVRLQPDLIKRLDTYASGITRPEAIRRILEEKLR